MRANEAGAGSSGGTLALCGALAWIGGVAAFAACAHVDEVAGPDGAGADAGAGRRAPRVRAPETVDGYELPETRALVARVEAAAALLARDGEAAFPTLRREGSAFRTGEDYVFVLDPAGVMLVHPDPALEGRDARELRDVDGRPIVRGLLETATPAPGRRGGWYHYQWPVPGGLLPRWKSSWVLPVTGPSGRRFVVGAGIYDDRMERRFVVELVQDAARALREQGPAAFEALRDPLGRFRPKDTYVFVLDRRGVARVHPGFPNLEGRSLLDFRDRAGARPIEEMLTLASSRGAGWVDYFWPRPGEAEATEKSTYVQRVQLGDDWVLVGAGVYLQGARRRAPRPGQLTAPELVSLVNDAAKRLAARGAGAYAELRKPGTRFLHDDTYVFVWTLEGKRVFHGANPASEGEDVRALADVDGRPIGHRMLEAARSPAGEGWVHYLYPEPGELFPTWKSSFVRRVIFPDGTPHLVGAGVYSLRMDRVFIEDVVDRAAALIAARGREAFPILRDRTGPFFFMDTYVFVDSPQGVELVNAGQPSLEGRDLLELRDVDGRQPVREYVDAALRRGSAWVRYRWYRPGENTPAEKHTFVRRVQAGDETFIVGSGLYPE